MVEKTKKVLEEVLEERKKQNKKWGVQDHNPIEWIGILTEEVGEASKDAVDWYFGNKISGKRKENDDAIQQKLLKDYRTECIQVAAVAVQMVESIDRNKTNFFYKKMDDILGETGKAKVKNQITWTHWYEVLPGYLARECIVLREKQLFSSKKVQILTADNDVLWVEKDRVLEKFSK